MGIHNTTRSNSHGTPVLTYLRDGAIAFILGLMLATGTKVWAKCGFSFFEQDLRLSSASEGFPWPPVVLLTTTDGGDTFSVRVDLDIEEDSGLSHNLVLVSSGHAEQP